MVGGFEELMRARERNDTDLVFLMSFPLSGSRGEEKKSFPMSFSFVENGKEQETCDVSPQEVVDDFVTRVSGATELVKESRGESWKAEIWYHDICRYLTEGVGVPIKVKADHF